MEFVSDTEVLDLLKDHGVTASPRDDDRIYLDMDPGPDGVRVLLTTAGAGVEASPGTRVVQVESDQLADAVEGIIHKLHLDQLLLVPVGKWRQIFDVVAFDLAENEAWQAIDATATVELNTRDPLLCEPGDYHTVAALVRALLNNAETPEQGFILTTTSVPLLVEFIPAGAVRVCFGNQVMADEAAEALFSAP